jgi:hypothetical protein
MRDPAMTKLDFISSIVLIAFGGLVLLESWRMPRFEEQAANIYSAPGLVPGVLGVVLLLCGFIIFIRSLVLGGWRLTSADSKLEIGVGARNVLITVAISSVYVLLLIGNLPFWLATTIYGFAYTAIFEYRSANPLRTKLSLLVTGFLLALAIALTVTLVFERIFLVRMP